MLYLIGLGLHDEMDVSLKGIEAAKKCDKVFIELYTSPWRGSLKRLEEAVGKKIRRLKRVDLEDRSKAIIEQAYDKDVAIFVPGDPLVATTHSALVSEARLRNIQMDIIHSSSIFSAVAETGLHIYKFGQTTTIAYPEENYFPTSPYKVIAENKKRGLHTLVLLDVKAENRKYMTIPEAVEILEIIESKENEGVFTKDSLCVGVARLGSADGKIVLGTADMLKHVDFGRPPHALIVLGNLHFSEKEFLEAAASSGERAR